MNSKSGSAKYKGQEHIIYYDSNEDSIVDGKYNGDKMTLDGKKIECISESENSKSK